MQRNSVLERDVQRYKERREIERQVRITRATYGVPPNKCCIDRIASVNPPVVKSKPTWQLLIVTPWKVQPRYL